MSAVRRHRRQYTSGTTSKTGTCQANVTGTWSHVKPVITVGGYTQLPQND